MSQAEPTTADRPTPPPPAYDMATGRPVPDPSKPAPEPKSIRLG